MRIFPSVAGDGTLFFDNLTTGAGVPVAYDPQAQTFVQDAQHCANRNAIGCNWVAQADQPLCQSCAMTALAPDPSMPGAQSNWAEAEAAKRWVLANLRRWGWFGGNDPGTSPVFHMLAEGVTPVVMGHAQGVLTISIEEADPIQSVARREALNERFRTMIGHLRHEMAHMLWWRLSLQPDFIADFRGLFGDERADYPTALDQYYANGPAPDWPERYLTPYASAHPHEDWAETAAHLLHLVDSTDSFLAAGLSVPGLPAQDWDPYDERDPERLTEIAARIAIGVNHVNRSMGLYDIYPFVLTEASKRKLAFVHTWLRRGPLTDAA